MVLGPYTLTRKLGQGGFGSVWLADQSSPVKREVALKILSPGRVSEEVVARFEQERQALAVMDHPNIARIFDAGTTDSGLPYFAMEVVHGQPITRYCDERRLPLRDRLALFIPVCRAVQHAHAKGIVHRDLKPSNVLVAEHDGKPVPKVIDFGIAKAIGVRPDAESGLTLEGQMIGTPVYMSPEQVSGRTDVDTRSDVYSLGALLYELLVGITPVDPKTLRDAGWAEMERLICELDPPRPSDRAAAREEETASFRQTNTIHLVKKLRGELDWIVMRALEKDRERRYETANALALELGRHLNNEPVLAGPPSVSYRLGKFVRRQKGPLSAAVALFVVSLAGTVMSWWQAGIAKLKQTEAEAATALAQERADTIRRNLYFAEMSLAGQSANQASGIITVAELTRKWLPKPGEPDLRGWEWYFLDSLTRSDLATLRGHTDHINSVVWSPDNSKLASASGDGTIRIWDRASLLPVYTLRGHIGAVKSVDWSRDGALLASGGADRTVRVWDATSRAEKIIFKGHEAEIVQVLWNPDSDRLASTDRGSTLKVWYQKKGQEAFSIRDPDSTRTFNASWSPDGSRLAIGSSAGGGSPGIRIVDGNDGRLIEKLPQVSGILGWSPDGRCLAGSYGQGIFVWDLSAKKRISNWLTNRGNTFGISWSPDSQRVVSCGTDHTVTVWNPTDGSEIFSWAGHHNAVNSVAWSPDGSTLASGGGDTSVKLWDFKQAENPESLEWRKTFSVSSLSWSPDGRQVVAAGYQALKIFDVETQKLKFIIDSGKLTVGAHSWSPDGTRLALGRTDGVIQIWNVATGNLLSAEPAYPSNRVAALAWKPDGSMFISGGNIERGTRSLKTWDGITGKMIASVKSSGYINSTSYDPSGKRIAVTQGDSIAILDSVTLETRFRFDSGHRTLMIATWSPDGRMLASGGDGAIGGVPEVRIWNASTGKLRCILTGHHSLIRTIAWSHDGSRLASGDRDGVVKIWDPETGAPAFTIFGPPKGISGLAWSPDGTRLLYGGEDKVAIWDASKSYEMERERLQKEANP